MVDHNYNNYTYKITLPRCILPYFIFIFKISKIIMTFAQFSPTNIFVKILPLFSIYLKIQIGIYSCLSIFSSCVLFFHIFIFIFL